MTVLHVRSAKPAEESEGQHRVPHSQALQVDQQASLLTPVSQ